MKIFEFMYLAWRKGFVFKKYSSVYLVPLDSDRSPIIKSSTVYRWFRVETYLREKGLKFVERDSSENHPDPWTRGSRWLWTRIEDRDKDSLPAVGNVDSNWKWKEHGNSGTRINLCWKSIWKRIGDGWPRLVTDVAQRGWIGMSVLIGLGV